MNLIKNKLTTEQSQKLPEQIQNFLQESKIFYQPKDFLINTLSAINDGIEQKTKHDIWLNDSLYCLCRQEIDADGKKIYTAYQLWIDPKYRIFSNIRKLIRFLKFYSQKQQFDRLYILSSRLDKIKAYQRGLGYKFKPDYLVFRYEN